MLFEFLTLNIMTFSVITSQVICWLSFLLTSQATHSVWGDGKLIPSVCWFACLFCGGGVFAGSFLFDCFCFLLNRHYHMEFFNRVCKEK